MHYFSEAVLLTLALSSFMLNLQESLEKIGFNDKQVAVYLAALELGPQPVSSLAKRAHLNRSTAYTVLTTLVNKGLVSLVVRDGLSRYVALPPKKLLRYIDNQKSYLSDCRREIEDLLPKFESLSNVSYSSRPRARYFEGVEGVKTVMEDTLASTELLRCYSTLHKWFEGPLASYIRDYGRRRIFEAEIPLKALVHRNDLSEKYLTDEYPQVHFEYRFIPDHIGIVDNEINIYDNKIAIVSLRENDFFGLIIESSHIAESQKAIFELAWHGASDNV